MTPEVIGLSVIGLPALVVAALLLWRRHRAVFFFFVALLAVGLGYLYATGAAGDIGLMVLGLQDAAPAN